MTKGAKVLFYIVLALIFAGIIAFLIMFNNKIFAILSPFLIGIVIAYAMYPIILRFERKGIKRSIAIILVYIFTALVLYFLGMYVIPHIVNNARELISKLPEITGQYQGFFDSCIRKIKYSNWPPEVKDLIFGQISNGTQIVQVYLSSALNKTISTVASAVIIIFNIVLSMIIAYYFIKDVELLKRCGLMLIPKRMRNGAITTGREVNSIVSHFIQGQLLTALIVGILETIGLYVAGIKYPFILGAIGGITNIIPYFGPILGAIPAVALALIESPYKALLAALVFVVVQQLDNAFISPKIIEGRLGLHPISTILAVLIGGEFFGIIGMLVAVPIMAIIKVILKRAVDALA